MERRQRRRPGNLPAEVTSFVGRTADLQAARGLIGEARLVTLIGAGGVGKTRLAIRLGEELGRGFPGGVCLVDLAQVAEGADVAATVSATIADVLDHRAALLILDGCEPRLDDCATFIANLLHATTAARVLTTSRQPLGILGEHLLEVGPMATPAPGTPVDRLRNSDAVALFLERVSAATPSFVLSDDTASAVVRLCRRVGGLPLALELAAIRLHALSLDELLSQLADPRQLMRLHSRSPQPRQRSLDASHSWSHALCSAAEQRLWARLAVFPERFDLDAATAVCAGVDHGRTEIAESLAGLVEKSVVHRTDAGSPLSGSPLSGYRFAPTAREFGELLLDDNGDREVFRQRHASHFLATARRLVADLHSGGPAETVTAVHHDHENLATATDQLLSHGEAQSALTPATLLCLCPGARSPAVAHRLLSEVLAAATGPTPERAFGLWAHGLHALAAGAPAQASAAWHEAAATTSPGLAPYLTAAAGLLAAAGGDLPSAFEQLTRAVREHAGRGDQFGLQLAYRHLLVVAWHLDDPGRQVVAERLPGELGLGPAAHWSPLVGCASGLRHLRELSVDSAVDHLRGALDGLRHSGERTGDHQWIALCLEGIAQAEARRRDVGTAGRLLAFTGVLWDALGVGESFVGGRLDPRGELAAGVRSRLGDEAYAVSAAEGATLELDEAVDLALNQRSAPATGVLTPREREVAELVSQGLTNRAISDALAISTRTTESHVAHIMTKLGFARRTQIATWFASTTGPGDQGVPKA